MNNEDSVLFPDIDIDTDTDVTDAETGAGLAG